MLCPNCKDAQLVMSERKGVEIDYCPQCRGVWLDRGELDKILERSAAEESAAPAPRPQTYEPQHGDYKHGHHKHYRKKSIWHEIFD